MNIEGYGVYLYRFLIVLGGIWRNDMYLCSLFLIRYTY